MEYFHAENHQYTQILDYIKLIFITKQEDNLWRDNGPVIRQHNWELDGGLLMYIREEFLTYLCIDNMKNWGYSSGSSVPYNI